MILGWYLALAALAAAPAAPPPASAPPPNVIVVLVDDLRWDDLGVSGQPFVETPTMDRMAKEGVRFLNMFATTPLCSPSRAAILTGLYAHTNGIIDNTARDSASYLLPTFVQPMAKAGYQTGFFGKWHMGNDDGPRPGFTEWVAMRGQGEAVDPQFNVNGVRRKETGYVTDLLTDHVVSFLEKAGQRPFLVFLAHKAIHPNIVQRDDGSTTAVAGQAEGFVPAPRHAGRYAGATVPRRPNTGPPVVRKPALLRDLPGVTPLGPTTGTPDRDVRGRLEMLLAVDESLARIIATLKAEGVYERTVIIVTGDNGYFYGEHHLNDERRLAYEESIRLPLIVRYPGVAVPGLTPANMVQAIDLAPTILDLAGVADPVKRQGRSLVPLLRGRRPPWRHSVLVEYYSDNVFPRIKNMGYVAVRTERHKLIRYLELSGMDELYDLGRDPYELDNLMGTARGKALQPSLEQELARLERETGYPARR